MSSSSQSPEVDQCTVPNEPAPDGKVSNFHNPHSLQPFTIAIGVILGIFSVVVTAGRVYANRNCLKLADYLVFFGLVLTIPIIGISFALSKTYRHSWDIPNCWVDSNYETWSLIESILTAPALFLPKAAIFLYYLQIFSVSKMVRIGSKVGIAGALLLCIAQITTTTCLKILQNRDETSERLAIGFLIFSIATRCTSIVIDTYIFLLLIPILFKLNMSSSKRIQLGLLFATALLVIIVIIASIVCRVKAMNGYDGWWVGSANLLVMIEVNVTLIVASLPGFTIFWRIYIADTPLFNLLRRNHRGRHSNQPAEYNAMDTLPKPRLWTFGSSQRKQRCSPELITDTTLVDHITTPTEAATTTAHLSLGTTPRYQEIDRVSPTSSDISNSR